MSSNSRWTVNDISDLSGKIAIVTGANSGLGYEVVRGLARKGAQVVLASRDKAKGEKAVANLRKELPNASLDLMLLDLADLASVRQFAEAFMQRYPALHMLVNNAGVMAIPYRQTVDGFEMQFGTNHLGHFALTGLLLPQLLATEGARIVTTSSMLHRSGTINFSDLQSKGRYSPGAAYSQSKLANLLFTYELEHKLEEQGAKVISVASHPGYAATNLQSVGPRMEGSFVKQGVMAFSNVVFAQSAAMGALPTLYAATASEVHGGEYFGPGGPMEWRGYPTKVRSNEISYHKDLAELLWQVSEDLTGIHYSSLVH